MTKRIKKFRFWDSYKKEFVYCSSSGESLDQFIHILDSTGKEIYENDLVRVGGNCTYGVVTYLPACAGYSLTWPGERKYRWDLHTVGKECEINPNYLTVVGNIYENPHFIEDLTKELIEKKEELENSRDKEITKLIPPDSARWSFDQYGRKIKFKYKGHKYYIYNDSEGGCIQSYEKDPHFGTIRNICGMDFRLNGMDTGKFLWFKNRVTWESIYGYMNPERWQKIIDNIKLAL